MQPILRASRVSRARLFTSPAALNTCPRRFAYSSYGNEQSGHQQGQNETNPKAHLEHPGPKAPADKASGSSTKPGGGSSESTSQGGSPAIHRPKSAAEKHDPEVRKHNEEMAQRSDRSANQLSEEDNKVDKNFWKGDVGDAKQNK